MAYLKDVAGEELYIRLSIGALRRFEKRAKIDFFSKFEEAVAKLEELQKQTDVQDARLISELIKTIFPNLDTIAGFLYECAVYETERPEFDDFCDLLPATVLLESAKLIWEEIQRFMPAPPPQDESAGGSAGPKGQ